MAVVIDELICTGCSLCAAACPQEAIEVYGIARIEQEKCVECLECIPSCPIDAITREEEEEQA